MTCIIGLVDNDGTVWMGGDRAISGPDYSFRDTSAWPKVMRRGHLLIGIAGFGEHLALLQSHDIPSFPPGDALDTWLTLVFWPWWRDTLKAHSPDDRNYTLIFGGNGTLASMGNRGSQIESARSYIGAGYIDHAETVLWLDRGCQNIYSKTEDTEFLIATALRAEAEFSPGVGPPFDIINDRPE